MSLERLKAKTWKDSLEKSLGKSFEVLLPRMPSSKNAKYLEWKIWFEKLTTFFDREVVFVGHSLGGIFLAKYLSENKYPKKIIGTFLISAPFDEKDLKDSLGDFELPQNLDLFEKQGGEIHIYHSKDDTFVPFVDSTKYKKSLSKAKMAVFKDRGHFFQETLPELAKDIRVIFKIGK